MLVFCRRSCLATLALSAAALVLTSPVAAAPPEPSTQMVAYRPSWVGSTQIRWIIFTNRTGGPVTFGPVGIVAVGTAAFALHGDTCGGEVVELAAGTSCAYGVAFEPKVQGSFRARLVYAVARGRLASVELRGRAG